MVRSARILSVGAFMLGAVPLLVTGSAASLGQVRAAETDAPVPSGKPQVEKSSPEKPSDGEKPATGEPGKDNKAKKAQNSPVPVAPDAIHYQTILLPTSDAAVDSGMKASSQLLALEKSHLVGPYALAGRIRDDYERLQGALRSQGFYAGQISIVVSARGRHMDGRDPLLAAFLLNLPHGTLVKITVSAKLGPQFHISRILILPPPKPASKSKMAQKSGATQAVSSPVLPPGPPRLEKLTPEEEKAFGLKIGQPAIAGDIIAARERLAAFLQEEGYGLSDVSAPQGILQSAQHGLEVRIFLKRGPKLVIGPISLEGLKHVHPSYVRMRMNLKEGQLYQPSVIDQAQLNLSDTGLFSSVTVRPAPPIIRISPDRSLVKGVDQAMPLQFTFKPGKRYRISGDIGYSTDLGGRAGVKWLDRNLFGNGEQLRLAAIATGLGGTAEQGLGYDIYADFNKPDFMARNRTLNLRIEALRQLLYSYRQTAFFVRGGVAQPIGRNWNVSGSALLEQERINQFHHTRDYFIASLPLEATFDNTDRSNPIEPPTHGVRAALGVTPSLSMEHRTAFYLPLTAEASTYLDLHHLGISPPGRSIIALRATVGTIQGVSSVWNVPPDQRLYAGGPATVRGFRWQGVGPHWKHTKYAIGGTSMDAGTVEYRQRIMKSFGTALFVDAGQVGEHSTPGEGKVRVGYGGGVRYFTPIGPIRLDVAFPMNRPRRGDRWELYIGLGEVF
ncbi:autotransporter assembly complex protein TamA [Oecophyllibacter saccharovorans]|nr:BamA/TamA family outer membrane protein [Oecophyllibacter saccharovorans]